ncbi:MAG: GNAT family N-acetyltransferase [Candidatus Sericytochromatia bacterium]
MTLLQLQRCSESDSILLWQWANDPLSRQMALDPNPIPWQDHQFWFAEKIRANDHLLYIAQTLNHEKVGYFRCAIQDNTATLSYALSPAWRGKGYGLALLESGVKTVFAESSVNKIEGWVKTSNIPSMKIFSKAGFYQVNLEYSHEKLVLFRKIRPT